MKTRLTLLAVAYAALIAYGSLFPFVVDLAASGRMLDVLALHWPAHYSGADVLTNVLAYLPLGLLLVLAWRGASFSAAAVGLATLAGTAFSFSMELLQSLMPSRVPSLLDVAVNTAGTFMGAVLAAAFQPQQLPGKILARWRALWIRPGRLYDLGLCAIGLWTASQLTPFVPSLDVGNLRQGLAPLWRTLQHPERFQTGQFAVYALSIAGLAVLFRTLVNPGRRPLTVFFLFVAAVLLYKVPVVSRQLSLEAVGGMLAGAVLAGSLTALRARAAAWASAGLIAAGFAIAELASEPAGRLFAFNWVPFRGQMAHTLIGFASILESVWVATALAYLVRFATAGAAHGALGWAGGFLLTGSVFALEWNQQFLPGRVGDFTVVLLAAGAWAAVWGFTAGKAPATPPARHVWGLAGLAGLATTGAAFALVLGAPQRETRVDESKLPQLPAPEALPPVNLPRFHAAHPRLPHPSAPELAILRTQSPEWLRSVRDQAAGGGGELNAAILLEYAEPGSTDRELLHRRLMALELTWRGHEQAKPLALAYDWLYARWSEPQRAELRAKLVHGCQYLVDYIRKERLSPYNVILYNSPFQALMACSIALYGEDPRADALMAFTHDLWMNRVLPAWRQVMGRHGGWHEGGEYVGIGIGQAIYQVPAMWRAATGEDLFAREPGIRGFLDFLVYRTQPDGTHFRWGDGVFFDREVPDALALALEYGHKAAYSLKKPRDEPRPTSWPWGPLTRRAHYDPGSRQALPLAKHFDGIGMVVARSDWSAEATYVTFKAGDNYWSHVHLDQGAFTIYKGGPLAIDSGLYGPKYGADHHMNYSYQTIAHNTITVTDPADTVPAPAKGDDGRPIANDGGQRRVGSGWGVEAAPLDLAEWRAKAALYHTGRIDKLSDQDGLLTVAADITPAYTNELSGKGTFSHRTRRVERFWRVFGYDRIDDVVVVFDQVRTTNAAFRKRWLLHTLDEPHITGQGFSVVARPQSGPGRAGGRLEAKVLLPKGALINAVGGPGLDFLVDDRNYDEGGTLREALRKLRPGQAEPGAWRVELMPPSDALEDVFLVVLLPSSLEGSPLHSVRLLESDARHIVCEVAGARRTTRWRFARGANGVEVEVASGGETRHHAVPVRNSDTPPRPG